MNFSLPSDLVVIKVVLAKNVFAAKRAVVSCKVMRLKWEMYVCAIFFQSDTYCLGVCIFCPGAYYVH